MIRFWCCHLPNTTEKDDSVGGGLRSTSAVLVEQAKIVEAKIVVALPTSDVTGFQNSFTGIFSRKLQGN